MEASLKTPSYGSSLRAQELDSPWTSTTDCGYIFYRIANDVGLTARKHARTLLSDLRSMVVVLANIAASRESTSGATLNTTTAGSAVS